MDEHENRVIYKLSVNAEDMGKVIGKQGRVAKAIRLLFIQQQAVTTAKKFISIS